jgi:uncharacterized protein YjbI with pentapeptide repeats
MRRISLPSPSMAVSLAALTVALGGTSYAATQISSMDVKNNSLRSADIRNSSLTGSDVKGSSLTTSDIKDGSLRSKDFRAGQLPAGATGQRGLTGSTGAKGDKGDKGDSGPAGIGRWALINAAGTIEMQSGGFSITACYPAAPAAANGNCYINTNEDLADNGIIATIALQNQVNQGGGTMNGTNTDANMNADLTDDAPAAGDNLEFSGEISATPCGLAGVVSCAPTGTNNTNHVVVSPRLSSGERTSTSTRKRFYVVITGDSTDLIAP